MLALIAVGAGLLSAALVLWALGSMAAAAGWLAAVIALAALLYLYRQLYPAMPATAGATDWSLMREAAESDATAIAITDRGGQLVCANDLFGVWFSGFSTPPALPVGEAAIARLTEAARAAWRDGAGYVDRLARDTIQLQVEVVRSGRSEDHLIWRFRPAIGFDIVAEARRLVSGGGGDRLGESGVMAVLVGQDGRIRAANRVFAQRAAGRAEAAVEGRSFVNLLQTDAGGVVRLAREGAGGIPLRLVQVPLERDAADSPTLIFLVDDDAAPRIDAEAGAAPHLEALLSMLPFALALADRDGRFLFLNAAFLKAAGVGDAPPPVYPGDLVVREDKAAVADAVRRFAAGQHYSGDIAVRLRARPEETVALSIAGARGLGEAAVLLSLKDNSEESKLKRQVAQATKMQAVGQLAGGVAHDFNNILTAIIGHCDLMLMRHTPGDSDYDDIQQVKANSNRAASLTRQLLAFSRQQTLRPQVLQLPDVVSDVSSLLKRLLGETITLTINHGRNLAPVRADPGQLEQVIVNLAVNARDAMQAGSEGGGTLTLQTYPVTGQDSRQLNNDIMPVGEYTALRVTDTGVGIPAEHLAKIFEPFFTTKEVGKGTGLGLSTVYGIVKQSGGFIFAESEEGKGTSFVLYLPVHRADPAEAEAPVREKARTGELWGSGTILLVEDEDMVRAVAERALTRHGYKVVTATNGEEALERLAEGITVDLLISDVVMPTMDGPTMAREARARHPDLPLLFMSGYAEEQLRKSIDLDRMEFLPKPFSVQQLAEAARKLIEPK
ncbi:response regulator [Sphingomonas flavalba]|uniref:hybrid sensor histidine kinase/response regulator n=1 Tax=Sphingomonas flavalba TaxID=2559804 RepID=UPI0039E0BCC4